LYDVVSVEALPGESRSMAMKINGRTVAAAVTAADIRWLAGLEPDGRTASGTAARARLDEFYRIADSVPGAIAAAVHAELVSEEEAEPVRKLVLCRLDLLEKEFGWRSRGRAQPTPARSGDERPLPPPSGVGSDRDIPKSDREMRLCRQHWAEGEGSPRCVGSLGAAVAQRRCTSVEGQSFRRRLRVADLAPPAGVNGYY